MREQRRPTTREKAVLSVADERQRMGTRERLPSPPAHVRRVRLSSPPGSRALVMSPPHICTMDTYIALTTPNILISHSIFGPVTSNSNKFTFK